MDYLIKDMVMIEDKEIQINVKKNKIPLVNLIGTSLWTIALILLPQLIMSIFIGVFFGGVQNNSLFILVVLLTSPLIFIPLLIKATNKKSWKSRFNVWAIKSVRKTGFVKYLVVGTLLWGSIFVLNRWINVPVEPFMIDIKNLAIDNIFLLLVIFLTICLIIPIMEELLYRGWLYSQIAKTSIGEKGALFVTSCIFTISHAQYEHVATFIFIFFIGLFLGLIRYKSNNAAYSVIIHIQFNFLTTINFFYLT